MGGGRICEWTVWINHQYIYRNQWKKPNYQWLNNSGSTTLSDRVIYNSKLLDFQLKNCYKLICNRKPVRVEP